MADTIYGSAEYLRPWKLATFSIGLALLIMGSYYTPAPDWDIPVSVIMATFTYLTAPWCMHIFLDRRWRLWPLMLLATWFSVDGCYAIYWYWKDPSVLELMREVNWPASLSLYGMCGVIWLHRGSLADLQAQLVCLVSGSKWRGNRDEG